MASAHVPLSPLLALPARWAHVTGYLTRQDPALRLRRSVEVPTMFVLERRCRRACASNVGKRDTSDLHVQNRDGYVHVSTVHENWLSKPWNIIRALQTEGVDMFARTAASVDDELLYEKAWLKESRRRRRKDNFRAIAREAYDVLNRVNSGGERSRISNAGIPQ